MINRESWKRLLAVLIDGTDKDKILWENTMLNIHETFFHEERILIDVLQDDPSTFIIGHSVLQMRGVGIEELTQHIDGQYKRLKKHRYSEKSQTAQVAIESRVKSEQLQNDENFNAKVEGLLAHENTEIVCGKCGGNLSELGKHLATFLGVKDPLCEKCNPYKSKLTETDRWRIAKILLGTNT